jgi:hypothetical protein
MFRTSMRSSSGSFLFISLSMLLILKIIKIFKKCYHSVVVMWQHMSSVPVMRTVWRRELQLQLSWCEKNLVNQNAWWNGEIKMCFDLLTFDWNISYSKNNAARYHECIYMYIGHYVKYLLFLSDCKENWIFRQIFWKYWNTNFHVNPSIQNRVIPCGKKNGWTDGRTDRETWRS